MKIGFDAKRFFHNNSGLGNYSRDLVRILSEFAPENEYLLFAKKPSEKGKNILSKTNVIFQQLKKSLFSRQYQMGKQAQDFGCDIFHGLSGEIPLVWRKKPIKKIVTIHDLIFVRYPQFYSYFDRKIHFWKFKNAAEKADTVIAISEQTKKDIIEFLKIDEQKIEVVYQGCHSVFRKNYTDEQKKWVRDKFQLPKRFVLNVGTIEERKNIFSVVQALENTDIPLVIIGKKTKYFQKIQQHIQKNSMETQIQFLENVNLEELAIIYQLADIFIYPSLFEGFGIPIIESLYSKTPVITSNISCLPEAGGEYSLYINPLDAQDIRSKILHLWDNHEERKRRAEKSYEFVQKFNDEEIAKNLINVYKK